MSTTVTPPDGLVRRTGPNDGGTRRITRGASRTTLNPCPGARFADDSTAWVIRTISDLALPAWCRLEKPLLQQPQIHSVYEAIAIEVIFGLRCEELALQYPEIGEIDEAVVV